MNRTELFLLCDYLSRFITFGTDDESNGCDHTLLHTREWIAARNLDQETCLGWLQQRGGWCDCMIVSEIFLAAPHELGETRKPLPLSAFDAWMREI